MDGPPWQRRCGGHFLHQNETRNENANVKLSDIKRAISGPPRIVIYGVPGIGKTTFAAGSDACVFLPIEDGISESMGDVHAFPHPSTYEQVVEAVQNLIYDEHGFRTLVIDSLDKLEPMIWDYVCRTAGKKSIEDFGYGKGYTVAAGEWRYLITGLDILRETKGMTIVMVAHSTVVKAEPPETDPYDRYQMRLHKAAEATIVDWADAVLFANYQVKTIASGPQGSERRRGISDGSRIVHTVERAAWRAKNRYRLPDTIPLEWKELAEHIPSLNQTAPATTNTEN